MGILASLHHVTHYRYKKPASLGMQTIRLRPAPHTRSHVQSYSLNIEPSEHYINWQQDPFGNFLAKIVFPEKVSEFKIEVDLLTEIKVFNPFDFFLEESAKEFPVTYDLDLKAELAPYLELKESGTSLMTWMQTIPTEKKDIIDFLVDINQKLNQSLTYVVRLEPGVQTCEETLTKKSGSCRDMAWLLAQILRHLGLATRFASGYLIQLAADVKSLDGPSGTEVDFTDLHAWTEVYLPGAGWVGLDPTSGLFTGEGHIPLCCTPSPSSAAPVSGTLEEGVTATLEHEMTVKRLVEAPRVTRPYTDDQWQAIDALGDKVDQTIKKQDIRLTMGGEPTFVSLDDREHDAWHYAALGANKKTLAKDMLFRMKDAFAPGGLHMFIQGKWYPGEILPRWAMPCFWRKDKEPIWKNPKQLADPDVSHKHTLEHAKSFIESLAAKMGIPDNYVIPAREDTPYYLWKEHRLPCEDEMMVTDVYEKMERQRLQSLMDNNLNKPVGYVLPLHYSHTRNQWISNPWSFRSKHMILLTGDSPIGFRLPLASLPKPKKSMKELTPERCTFDDLKGLPKYSALKAIIDRRKKTDDATFKQDANGLIITALCAEVRAGVLHLFLPPISYAEHFLELLVAIEVVSESLNIPVVIEGYTPPSDERLTHFSVTPDPGVIEVNVQPSENWSELKLITDTVYREARLSRLSAEKFMLDGKLVGTGGGNHIVMGALSPKDSPFLRRPDLLRSMVLFWQNHPSLSYLFSGLYIGPTSQSPRIDEARHDALYELEIAFQQIPEKGDVPPWLVDRLFRNLLVDLTGNTHRAEFCIDKLYSPDSSRGRLGLLEMRGFEMTPHPQMNLLQALLIRALISSFWKKPYQSKMTRWGSRLHDKFMLPHFIREDLSQVLDYLKAGEFHFDLSWFEPFFTFRFPRCGEHTIAGATISLHSALEPWPVMGEEPIGGGVSRSVDATVERLQVTVTGLSEDHYVLTCNGRRLPLHKTEVPGVQVAGLRYKAWAQPASLHPKLPIDAPLTFDIIDVIQERSLGGCRYHVKHPGGLGYETFPVNENEAEGRKLSRFENMGHTPGKVTVPPLEANTQFPYTLDLRYNRKT